MKPPRLFVTAGMQGSGSTWLFNAVRYAFLNAGCTVYSEFATAYHPEAKAEIHVVKIHNYDPKWRPMAEKILMTERSLFDCAASCVAKGNLVPDEPGVLVNFMRELKTSSDYWKAEADAAIPYRDIYHDPRTAIDRVLRCLGLEKGAVDTLQDLDNLKRTILLAGDHVTHMWADHIKDGRIGAYTQRLSLESVCAIEEAFVEA